MPGNEMYRGKCPSGGEKMQEKGMWSGNFAADPSGASQMRGMGDARVKGLRKVARLRPAPDRIIEAQTPVQK